MYLSVGGRRKPSGDKGAAPPRAQGALPMPVAAGALCLIGKFLMAHYLYQKLFTLRQHPEII